MRKILLLVGLMTFGELITGCSAADDVEKANAVINGGSENRELRRVNYHAECVGSQKPFVFKIYDMTDVNNPVFVDGTTIGGGGLGVGTGGGGEIELKYNGKYKFVYTSESVVSNGHIEFYAKNKENGKILLDYKQDGNIPITLTKEFTVN